MSLPFGEFNNHPPTFNVFNDRVLDNLRIRQPDTFKLPPSVTIDPNTLQGDELVGNNNPNTNPTLRSCIAQAGALVYATKPIVQGDPPSGCFDGRNHVYFSDGDQWIPLANCPTEDFSVQCEEENSGEKDRIVKFSGTKCNIENSNLSDEVIGGDKVVRVLDGGALRFEDTNNEFVGFKADGIVGSGKCVRGRYNIHYFLRLSERFEAARIARDRGRICRNRDQSDWHTCRNMTPLSVCESEVG